MKYDKDFRVPRVDRSQEKTLCVLCVLCGLKTSLESLSELTRRCGDAENQRMGMRKLSTVIRGTNLPNHKTPRLRISA